jgi:hypothetical protein
MIFPMTFPDAITVAGSVDLRTWIFPGYLQVPGVRKAAAPGILVRCHLDQQVSA